MAANRWRGDSFRILAQNHLVSVRFNMVSVLCGLRIHRVWSLEIAELGSQGNFGIDGILRCRLRSSLTLLGETSGHGHRCRHLHISIHCLDHLVLEAASCMFCLWSMAVNL